MKQVSDGHDILTRRIFNNPLTGKNITKYQLHPSFLPHLLFFRLSLLCLCPPFPPSCVFYCLFMFLPSLFRLSSPSASSPHLFAPFFLLSSLHFLAKTFSPTPPSPTSPITSLSSSSYYSFAPNFFLALLIPLSSFPTFNTPPSFVLPSLYVYCVTLFGLYMLPTCQVCHMII